MTSSGHVSSSGSCPIDKSWPLSYRLSFGTIPLSGFVSGIFSAKVATTIITWWRHQWRHKTRINYPWGTYRHTIHRNILLKYRRIPTRIAGEEAFLKKIMTASLWRHPVTWRHRDHVQSTDYDFLIRYLASFKRYLAPKLRQRLLRDNVINDVIRPGWTIREEHRHTMYRNIVLKYRPIPTRIAGEETF